ncbi:MAG TPA: hypothetical protein VFR34_13330 [Paracoccaceae bacterium]|nr:hypothetical protein [Paracoccaceae bacterium]
MIDMLELREVTLVNLRPLLALEVRPDQADQVAPAAVTVAQSH